MAPHVEVSIPNSTISSTPKPHTVYNITLRLPLRSFNLPKRYSDFTTLHSDLTSQAGVAPNVQLPAKSWFTRTTSSPQLTEERRQGLEAYLNAINGMEDDRWRNTSAWRTFLNLPSSTTSRSNTASNLHSTSNGADQQPITDPIVWLDRHRDLKSQLHDARLALTRRDQASTAQGQHEASAQAKKSLVRAGTSIATLDRALQSLSSASTRGASLGEGELRRRRDLLASTRREREGLENLQNAMVAKAAVDTTIASAGDKASLIGAQESKPRSGRVLGKETEKTRALDNQGVLQLQKQLMEDQDEGVTVLAKAVARQKELGIQIQEELEVQNEVLGMLDEDATRVQGKMDVARKRIGKIS